MYSATFMFSCMCPSAHLTATSEFKKKGLKHHCPPSEKCSPVVWILQHSFPPCHSVLFCLYCCLTDFSSCHFFFPKHFLIPQVVTFPEYLTSYFEYLPLLFSAVPVSQQILLSAFWILAEKAQISLAPEIGSGVTHKTGEWTPPLVGEQNDGDMAAFFPTTIACSSFTAMQ